MRDSQHIQLSVIAPAHDEADNVAPLVDEIAAVLEQQAPASEIIVVDDGSGDATFRVLRSLMPKHRSLRVLRMLGTPLGRGQGQSAAFHAAIRASRGKLIAMLDADRQNDPHDLPGMLQMMQQTGADMVQGDRTKSRQDGLVRSFSSRIGRSARRLLLGDTIADTGCSLRVMSREVALRLPLEYRGMHRFIPLTARQFGYTVVEMPVRHRQRTAGQAKYGIWNRALPGLIDCFAVRWMNNRRRPVRYETVHEQPVAAEELPRPDELLQVEVISSGSREVAT